MTSWRENIDPTLKNYLEALIKDVNKNRNSFELANNKANAQLWLALAAVYKQTFNLDQRIKYIEKLLKDILEELKQNKLKIK